MKGRGRVFSANPSRRHPRKRVIQYSRVFVIESKRCGVLDAPASRSMTVTMPDGAITIECHHRACAGSTSYVLFQEAKTWMAGSSPANTSQREARATHVPDRP